MDRAQTWMPQNACCELDLKHWVLSGGQEDVGEPFRVGCKWWRVTSSLQFVCVCVTRTAVLRLNARGLLVIPQLNRVCVCVCGGSAWWDAQQLQCFFPVANTCERLRPAAKLSGLSMCPLEQLITSEKNADRKCTSYFIEQKQCSDSNLIITMRGM